MCQNNMKIPSQIRSSPCGFKYFFDPKAVRARINCSDMHIRRHFGNYYST